jgi:hypothetical protein
VGQPTLGTNSAWGTYTYPFNDKGASIPPSTLNAINLHITGTFGGETLAVNILVNYADGTALTFGKFFTATQDYALTSEDLAGIMSSGNLITGIGIRGYTSNSTANMVIQAKIMGGI